MNLTLSGEQAGTLENQSVTVVSQFGGLGSSRCSGFDQTASIPITGEVLNYAAPAFSVDAAPPGAQVIDDFLGTGNNVLYLGMLQQGQQEGPVTLGVQNDASGPSDVLSALTWDNNDVGFTTPGYGTAFGLAAGQQQATETIDVNTSTPGWHWDTVTMVPYSSNASGYVGALATQQLTLYDYIAPKL